MYSIWAQGNTINVCCIVGVECAACPSRTPFTEILAGPQAKESPALRIKRLARVLLGYCVAGVHCEAALHRGHARRLGR